MPSRDDPALLSQRREPSILLAVIPSLGRFASRNQLIILVLVSFALTPLLVPLWAPVSIGDAWVYVRSVEILVREGRLHILDLAVVTLLFQVAWGSLFASLFSLSVVSSLFTLLLARQAVRPTRIDSSRASAGIVLMVGLGQVAGVLPPSFHFRDWIISVDRYLLSLVPLSLCLGFWALRGMRPSFGASWVAVTLVALVSIAGTRDALELQKTT